MNILIQLYSFMCIHLWLQHLESCDCNQIKVEYEKSWKIQNKNLNIFPGGIRRLSSLSECSKKLSKLVVWTREFKNIFIYKPYHAEEKVLNAFQFLISTIYFLVDYKKIWRRENFSRHFYNIQYLDDLAII
jgi:hypothetical protein